MTVRIVDRRFDSRNKSSVNRSRFLRRFKGQIRKAVSESVNRRKLRDLENGEKISIPGGDIAEPQFTYGKGGKRETVHPGNDRFTSGEEVDRPLRERLSLRSPELPADVAVRIGGVQLQGALRPSLQYPLQQHELDQFKRRQLCAQRRIQAGDAHAH